MKFAFRFKARDADLLDFLADRVEASELPGGAGVFRHAATAARTGDILFVEADSVEEAAAMGQGYSQYGVEPPTIDYLPDWARPR